LSTLWPRGEPQWDALGRAASGEVVLVEAKAHINELFSPATGAIAESSIALIQSSLREVQQALGVVDGFDWSKQFYQYALRLAWEYWLDGLNASPTKLVFVYFVGDADVSGPATAAEWRPGIEAVHSALGLTVSRPFVTDVFIDVPSLA